MGFSRSIAVPSSTWSGYLKSSNGLRRLKLSLGDFLSANGARGRLGITLQHVEAASENTAGLRRSLERILQWSLVDTEILVT